MFKNFGNPIPEDLSHHIKCQTCAILILKPLHPALPDPESSPDASLQLLPSESRTVHLPVRLQTRAKPEWKHRLSGKSRDPASPPIPYFHKQRRRNNQTVHISFTAAVHEALWKKSPVPADSHALLHTLKAPLPRAFCLPRLLP